MSTEDDYRLVDRYAEWSAKVYAAGFMEPSPDHVAEFRLWMERERPPDRQRQLIDYEIEFLEEFRSQENTNG